MNSVYIYVTYKKSIVTLTCIYCPVLMLVLNAGVSLSFSPAGQMVFTDGKKGSELNFIIRKTLHYMVKPDRPNRPHSQLIGPVPSPLSNPCNNDSFSSLLCQSRKANGVDISGSIILFDEAHNLVR